MMHVLIFLLLHVAAPGHLKPIGPATCHVCEVAR